MTDPFFRHLLGVEFGIAAVETRVAVDNLEVVVVDNPDLVGCGDIGEAHGFSVPLQFTMKSGRTGQAYSKDSHVYHLGERTGNLEVGRRLDAVLGRFLACSDPVLLMGIGTPYVSVSSGDSPDDRFGLLEEFHRRP